METYESKQEDDFTRLTYLWSEYEENKDLTLQSKFWSENSLKNFFLYLIDFFLINLITYT